MPMVKYTSDKTNTNKSAMRCQHCDFTCTFASQLIQHKKSHSNDSKTTQKILNINVHLASNDKAANFEDEIKGSIVLRKSGQQSESKKEITLKKIKFTNANQAQHSETAAKSYNLKNCIPNTARIITVKTFDVKSKQGEPISNCLSASSTFQDNNKIKADNMELKVPSPLLNSALLCGQCNYVAKNKDDLIIHKAEHEIIYSCTECDYRTHVRKNFERHEWCHVVDFPFKCQYCSFSSNADNAVKRHITSYHLSIRNSKEKHKSTDVLNSDLPVKVLKVEHNSSHSDSTEKLLDDVVIEHKDEGGSSKWHCHSCNMDFNNQLSTNKHAKLVHNKFLKDCVVVGKTESDVISDNQLIDNSECQKALSNHSIQKIKTFVMNRSSKQKDHSPCKINNNVFKCAHCTFVTDEFDKLKHHLEHESNNPNHVAKTTIKLDTEKHLLQAGFVAEKPQNCLISNKLETDTSQDEPVLEVKKPSDHIKKKLATDNEVVIPITNLTSKLISLECSEVDDKLLPLVDKLKVKCLFCKYMTYSAKCLKKHLLKEHSNIVVNKKLLQEFTRKCFICSLENASQTKKIEDEETQKSDFFPLESNSDDTGLDDKTSDGVMLQMSVQSENIKVSPVKRPKLTDPQIKFNDSFTMTSNVSNTRRNVFKCSVCNRTSNFKCNIKKHIEAIHPNATIIHYKNRMEPDGNKLVLVNQEKSTAKVLEKISFLENEQITDVKIEIDESLSNKSNKVTHETEIKSNKIGMADDLRIKRFKCSICPYRSNFRNNISNHVNMRHKNSIGAHFSVMSVEEARETLPFYSYKRYDFELYTNNDGENYVKQNGHIKETSPNDDSFDNDQPNYVVAMKNFDKDEPKKCRICPFVTNKSEILKLHMNYHQPQKRNELSCPYCPFFVNTTRLMRHHLALHEASNNNQQTNGRQVNCSYSSASLNYALNNNVNNNNNNNLNGITATGVCSDPNGLKNVFNWNFFISNVKFCRAKYICELCPFTSDERGDYWYHRKCHIDRDDRINHLKCDKCLYWAEDKKDYAQHISLHDLIYSPKVKLNQSDLSIGEFCRCDFANFKNFPDLACFKQLVCCYCSYKCSSVLLMRQHSVTHVAFSDANNSRLFKPDLNDADDVLGNLCSRLLNMNYSLAEESFDINKSSKTSSLNDKGGFSQNGSKPTADGNEDDQKNDESHNNTDDNDSMEMPILENMSELPTGTYDPHVLSVHLPTSTTPPCYTVNSRKEGGIAVHATITTPTSDLDDDALIEPNMDQNNTTDEIIDSESTSYAPFIIASDPISSIYNWIVEDERLDGTSVLSGPEEIIKNESDVEGEMEVDKQQHDREVVIDVNTSKPRTACIFAKTIFMNSLGLTHAD